MKISVPCERFFPESNKTIQTITIDVDLPPELDGETLLLKPPHILDTGYREVKLELN